MPGSRLRQPPSSEGGLRRSRGFAGAVQCWPAEALAKAASPGMTLPLSTQLRDLAACRAGLSPHRLPRAFRPGAVVFLAADPVLAHLGQDLARGRQGFGIDPLVRIPQVGSDD